MKPGTVLAVRHRDCGHVIAIANHDDLVPDVRHSREALAKAGYPRWRLQEMPTQKAVEEFLAGPCDRCRVSPLLAQAVSLS